jgi:NADH-quinone oxidoreductase subunit M
VSLLYLLILIPIAAAVATLLGAPARRTALAAAGANLAATLLALALFDQTKTGFQFASALQILPAWDLKLAVGADGLSLLMLLLTAIVTLAAVWVTPKVSGNENLFYAFLLFISAGATGAFVSTDLFFFYAFHELALIPTFLLIGIWGSGDRHAAAWKITIYLAAGSFILLIGIIGLYQLPPAGQRTFDIAKLQELAAAGLLKTGGQNWVYLFLLLGFGILISPAPAAMLHAGVLKKFGLYGLLRVAVPLLPDAAREWTSLLLILLIGNIIYTGLATIAQKRLDLMLGYSSVMHMGYIFLGIATFGSLGVNGAALLIFAHGLTIAALFAISGHVREKTGTLLYSELGGLAKQMPLVSFLFGLAAFASIGLPGFGNFASELLVFFGAFKAVNPGSFNFQIATILALWGVVISAVYMLRAYRAVFFGEMDKRWATLASSPGSLRWPVILLIAVSLLTGLYPQLFLNLIAPAVKSLLALH